jgi:RecA-family ATPase
MTDLVEISVGDRLPVISAAEWSDKPLPPRMWIMEDWLPMQRATLLTGEGGAGKSLAAQQMATCVALGIPFLGVPTRHVAALYVTCEDDRAELHRRQDGICRALGVSFADLDRKLYLLSRCGELDNSLLHYGPDGFAFSQFYGQLQATIAAHGICFLVLDNIAHLFEGNENVRQHVAVFCNALEALCRANGALTILFLGHPSKAGAQFSGSTAWENQVRSRIYLERGKEGDGSDPDVRMLSRAKANYASAGDAITMRWRDWAFAPHDPDTTDWSAGVAATAKATADNDLFLKLLAMRSEQKRPVSGRTQAQNYAPKEFAKMPQARGRSAGQFQQAMERLFGLKLISEEEYRGKDRHPHRRLVAVTDAAGRLRASPSEHDAGQSAGQSRDVSGEPAQTRTNAGEMDAGQLRGGSQTVGAGGEPPIGGLTNRQPPAVSEGWQWLDPSDGLPPIGENDDD